MSDNKFGQFELSNEIIDALTLLKFTEPTPVQKEVIPYALEGKDLVVKSKTGSGKTAAFAIPLCERVEWDENHPQAIVLEPTRELAVQVRDEIFHIGRKRRLKVPAVFGGFPIDKQMQTVKQKSHIVVGTPGRTLDLMEKGALKLDKVKYLVIDEADLMLDMGFLDDVKKVIEAIQTDKVMMLFSATMDQNVLQLSQKYMIDPKEIVFESKTLTVEEIEQEGYIVTNEEKLDLLVDVLVKENPDSCMIFCATREMVNILFHKLKKARIRCGMLHGLVDQKERLKTIEDFREARFRYLIATDVAARGIDFENITHVINYDFPTSKEAYVHRIGRTGRNGKSGRAISFITKDDKKMQSWVEHYTNVKIQICECPTEEELEPNRKAFMERQKEKVAPKAKKGAVFNKQITRILIGGGKKSKMRAGDIVGTICSIEGVVADDIGIIDVRDSVTHVEILNNKGKMVLKELETKTIKGKKRKVRKI